MTPKEQESEQPLDALVESLTSGAPGAAEEVFRTYEPYLRMVVRRHLSPDLRAKFDSLDVVQSVWIHLLTAFGAAGQRFADRNHLRAFLVQLTRHRFIDRLRRHRRALQHETPLDTASPEAFADPGPRPEEVAQAEELWQQLLDLCPPDHHDVLRQKRDGAVTSEVAASTGLHEGSVRRILGLVSRRLQAREARDQAGAGP